MTNPTPAVSPSLGPVPDFEAGSVSTIADRAVERGAALLGAKAGAAYLIQPGQHLLERIAFRGGDSEAFPPTLADDSTHPGAVSHLKGEVLWGPDGLTALPLIVGSRHDGVLLFKSAGPISHDELYLAQTVARQAAHALDHARMVEAEQNAMRDLQTVAMRISRLQAVTALLSRAVTAAEVARVIVHEGLPAVDAAQGALFLPNSDGRHLDAVETVGMPAGLAHGFGQVAVTDSGPVALAARTQTPVWITSQEEYAEKFSRAAPLSALACVPLNLDQQSLGVLSMGFARENPFAGGVKSIILTLARQCAQALDRARLYETERGLRQAAEEANRAKDEFLSIVSHELRTPLNSILGWIYIISSRGRQEPSLITRGLEVIQRSALTQQRLVEDLLDVSRIITGKLRIALQPVDMELAARSAVETVQPAVDAKQISLETEIEPGATVFGDAERLQQVLWNLLTNAIKFTPNGGRLELTVDCPQTELVRIRVRDSGIGFDEALRPYIFDRFRQGDSSTRRAHGGVGLGLSIVRYLVEAHGGQVTAESEGRGKGALFTVTLPSRPTTSDSTHQKKDPTGAGKDAAERLHDVTVLVVDDELDSREVAKMVLRAQGADVWTASSAEEAVAALKQTKAPNVLISDIAMPGMDGCQLMRQLRAMGPPFTGLPAIALTALARTESEQKVLSAGFQMYLAKPINPPLLVAAVEKLLQH